MGRGSEKDKLKTTDVELYETKRETRHVSQEGDRKEDMARSKTNVWVPRRWKMVVTEGTLALQEIY